MWVLTSKKTGEIYYLLPGKIKHTVGRSNADLVLKDDTSISRSHACIYPHENHIKVIDTGSKYGTFINENIENNISIKKNVAFDLKFGERVQFGPLGNEWTLSKLNICTLISSLNDEQISKVNENLKLLGGHLTDTWKDSCTHLTMSEITVTLKVLKALVENIPIVSCNYWEIYLKNLQNGMVPPKCEDYLPKLAENFLNKEKISFLMNDNRKKLFQGKTFLFMDNKLFDKYSSIIPTAGGDVKSLNKSISKPFLIKKDVIVMQRITSSQSQSSQTINTIEDYIKSKGRRLIPEFEIGLAIVHCNTEVYCNPERNISSGLLPDSLSLNVDISSILAEQTPSNVEKLVGITNSVDYNPSEKFESNCFSEKIIPESENLNYIRIETIQPEKQVKRIDSNVVENKDKDEEKLSSLTLKRKRSSSMNKDIAQQPKKQNICNNISQKESAVKSHKNSKAMSIEDFLDKSQISQKINDVDAEIQVSENQQSQSHPRKRGKLATIGDDSDDNDDELFNFGAVKKSKPNQNDDSNVIRVINNQQNTSKTSQILSIRINRIQTPSSSISVKPLYTSNISDYTNNIHKVRIPIKIDTEGWLSTSMAKAKIKSEKIVNEHVKVEVKSESIDASYDWVSYLKGGFEVIVKPMQLVSSHSFRNISVPSTSESNESSSNLLNATGKNFKSFIKKNNYNPQIKIIPTERICITRKFAA